MWWKFFLWLHCNFFVNCLFILYLILFIFLSPEWVDWRCATNNLVFRSNYPFYFDLIDVNVFWVFSVFYSFFSTIDWFWLFLIILIFWYFLTTFLKSLWSSHYQPLIIINCLIAFKSLIIHSNLFIFSNQSHSIHSNGSKQVWIKSLL